MDGEQMNKIEQVAKEQFEKIQRQGILIGAQAACTVILNKIADAKKKDGRFTLNDYKRLVGEIEKFCKTGVSRKVTEEEQNESSIK